MPQTTCVKQEAYEDASMHHQPRNDSCKAYDYASNQILVELLPLLGSVPMVFFLPSGTDQEQIDLVLSHGGQVSNIVECFTY